MPRNHALSDIFKDKELINELEDIIKINTKNRSQESFDKFILFYKRLCIYLNINPKEYNKCSNLKLSDEDIFKMVSHNNVVNYRYERWLKQICKFIFKCEIPKPLEKEIDYSYKLIPEIKNPYHYMTKEELEELWRVSDDIDKGLMLILLTTGMRVGALAQISKDKIDFEKQTVVVIEKNNKVKTYYLSNQVIEHIKKVKYFDTTRNSNSINRRIKNIAKRSNLKKIDHIHPHTFRHTFAKILVEKGIPVVKISKALGHNKVQTTERVYIQETTEDIVNQGFIPWIKPKVVLRFMPDFLVFD